jgi:hypothetical protein
MKHTPGPWTVHSNGHIRQLDPLGANIIPRNEADKTLIAAAPDLLEWTKAYLALLEGMAVSETINKEEQFFAHSTLTLQINRLKRMIAKAEGES